MELGRIQNLKVKEFSEHGAILQDDTGETVLLPNKESNDLKEGDVLQVFLYKDSRDRLIATRKKPKILMDELVPLEVKDTTRIGAFLDWGLEKDLFLPFAEQIGKISKGQDVFVKLYIDKSDRLSASMKIYKDLSTDSPYKKGDWVEGYIYGINPELGAFVAVDNKYNGLVNKQDFNDSIKKGETVSLRVVQVRPDGKLQLSPKKKAYKEIDSNAIKIIQLLKINNGFIPFNDQSSPEAIRAEFDISKGAFKKAVGFLLKGGYIEKTEDGIKLLGK